MTRALALGWLGSFGLVSMACAAAAPEAIHVPEPARLEIEVATLAPAAPPAETTEAPGLPVPPRPDDEIETIPVGGAWAATFGHTLSYADAMQNVRTTRLALEQATKPLLAAPRTLPGARELHEANALVELLNRRLAAAYFATDATAAQRLAALDEASRLLLRWSGQLDEMGLSRTPAAYRADRRVALTFEDIAEGPSKRWRSEGHQLAKLCVDRAAAEPIASPAARSCKASLDGVRQLPPSTPAPKTPAPAECACNPGDPLCSATLSGWCRPVR